jgi:predicted ATPase
MGKFDQLQRPEPHAAIVAAFTEFTTHVLEKGKESIDSIREQVSEGVSQGRVLTAMIPELEKILGKQLDSQDSLT